MTKTRFPMLIAGAAATLIPMAAIASFAVGDTVGTDLDEIRSQFEAQGYTVTEIEIEDDEIEVEYLDGDQEVEVTLAAATGEVLEIEFEDDDSDDD